MYDNKRESCHSINCVFTPTNGKGLSIECKINLEAGCEKCHLLQKKGYN